MNPTFLAYDLMRRGTICPRGEKEHVTTRLSEICTEVAVSESDVLIRDDYNWLGLLPNILAPTHTSPQRTIG